MSDFQLPDGREPIRFGQGRTAYYLKARGEGEVQYTFSMIRWMRSNRHRMTDQELSSLRKNQAKKLLENDPEFYSKIGKLKLGKKHKK